MICQLTSQPPEFEMERKLEAPAAEDGSHIKLQKVSAQWQSEGKYYTRIPQSPTIDSISPDKHGRSTADMSRGTGSGVPFGHRTEDAKPCCDRAAHRLA
jgi:hypothetical protein